MFKAVKSFKDMYMKFLLKVKTEFNSSNFNDFMKFKIFLLENHVKF